MSSLADAMRGVNPSCHQAKPLFLDRVVGVPVDECDVDLALSQRL
jgi:hypothetical protein